MSTVPDSVLKAVSLAADVCESCFALRDFNTLSLGRKCAAVSKFALSSLGAFSLGAEISGNLSMQHSLKKIQFFAGSAQFFFEAGIFGSARYQSSFSLIRAFDSMVGAAIQALRFAYESKALQQTKYLAMSEHQRDKVSRSDYGSLFGPKQFSDIFVEYPSSFKNECKAIIKEECEKELEKVNHEIHSFLVGEVVSKTHLAPMIGAIGAIGTIGVVGGVGAVPYIVQKITEITIDGVQFVAQEIGFVANKVIHTISAKTLDTLNKCKEFTRQFRNFYQRLVGEDRFNLLERNTIHPLYYGNPIFRQYVCSLTRKPIRHPVVDPTSHLLFERFAMEEHIDKVHISPITGLALKKEDLLVPGDIKKYIDDELQRIQDQLNIIDIELEEEEKKLQLGE